jgi:4-hydroxybenzoate polyprenyltransferase
MKYLKLYLRMLRYRSAMVLVLFMLLGAAWHGDVGHYALVLIVAAVALVSTYGCATSVNDLADWKIDLINLQGHSDRPLITGSATRRDLVLIAVTSSVISLVLGLWLSPTAALIIGGILFMNLAYSLPPLKVSHRPLLTPFYLVIGYIVLPYLLGVSLVGSRFNSSDYLYLPALYLLFLARISLKDFRDREGDAKNHKMTYILKYGKSATCRLSLTSLILGSLLLIAALRATPWLALGLSVYMVGLIMTIRRLKRTNSLHQELISIGFGARIGNGMLFILLGELLLEQSRAVPAAQIILYLSLTILYTSTFIDFWRHPDTFEFGSQAKQGPHYAPSR